MHKSLDQNNRPDFLLQFYNQYRYYLYKQVWEQCYDAQSVEDIVQTVWEKLITKGELLRTLEHRQRLNYISKTVENTIREIARKQKVVVCSLEQIAEPAYDGTRILEQMQDKWMKQEYFQATWALVDADTRELLERKYWLDETDEQIASAMNISKDSVRMYLSRARRKALFILDCYKENIL